MPPNQSSSLPFKPPIGWVDCGWAAQLHAVALLLYHHGKNFVLILLSDYEEESSFLGWMIPHYNPSTSTSSTTSTTLIPPNTLITPNTPNTNRSSHHLEKDRELIRNMSRSRVKVLCSSMWLIVVMQGAIRKEKSEVIQKVGSASTWGRRERERFRIPKEGVEVDAMQLIGREWFDMEGLDDKQRESMIPFYVTDSRI